MSSVPLLSYEGAPAGFHPLTINTVTGIRRFYREEGDKVRIIAVQPVAAILEANARDRYDAKGTLGSDKRMLTHAARIPVMLAEEWDKHACGDRLDPDDRDKAWENNLNSSEFHKLRVAEFWL